jgi:parvulin-like peptidyl-prolyl isomerase
MKRFPQSALPALLVVAVAFPVATVQAEIFEEIAAEVNGDVITSSDLEQEEQQMIAEAYRRYTGEELDEQVKWLRENMLLEIIDRKIMLDRARAMFLDIDKVKQVYYEGFMESQNINSEAEFEAILEQEGLTVDEFKERLLELYAPEEVMRVEVSSRISVSDKEIEDYYNQNVDNFIEEETVSIREIVLLADTEEQKNARRAEADAIVERARAGEEFATLARELSESGTKDEGGSLGELKRGDLSEQLEEVAFARAEGDVAAPIETPYGFHILMVESKTGGEAAGLDEIRDNLRVWLEDQKYREELQRFRLKMREEAEWCVKAKYRERIAPGIQAETCESL